MNNEVENIVPQQLISANIAPVPLWYKRQLPLWARSLLLTISLFFITGGAVNDGLTGWFWALPFFYLFYCMFTVSKVARVLLTSSLFVLMVLVSHFSWESPIVYPVIGQAVIAKEDISTITYPETNQVHYDFYSDLPSRGSMTGLDVVPKSSTGILKKISQGTEDMGTYPVFVVAFPSTDLYVADRDIRKKEFVEDKVDRSFCGKVEWSFCSASLEKADPMRKEFRFLASLMYYPALPLLFPAMFSK